MFTHRPSSSVPVGNREPQSQGALSGVVDAEAMVCQHAGLGSSSSRAQHGFRGVASLCEGGMPRPSLGPYWQALCDHGMEHTHQTGLGHVTALEPEMRPALPKVTVRGQS